MAVTSGFFNSINGDRVYNADDISRFVNGIVSDGVFKGYNRGLEVQSSDDGLSIKVLTGKAILNNKFIENTSVLTLDVAAGGTYARMDHVILRVDMQKRSGEILLLQGVDGSTKNYVPEDSDLIKEMVLAEIYVGAGTTVISQSDITDKRGDSAVCPWVRITDVAPRLLTYQNIVISANDISEINMGIPEYSFGTDNVFVFKNGLLLNYISEYTISGTGSDAKIHLETDAHGISEFTIIVQKIEY